MKKGNSAALLWTAARTKKYIPAVAVITVLNILLALSYIALALVSRNVIDIATADRQGDLIRTGSLLFLIVVLQVVTGAAISLLRSYVTGKITISLRDYLFTVTVRKEYGRITSHHSGDLLNRFTSDVDVVVSSAVSIIPSVASTVAKIIAGIGTLIFLNKTVALVILVIGVAVPALGRIINRKYKYLHKESQRTEGQTRSFLQECFQNVVVIKSFVSEKPFVVKLNRYMDENFRFKMKRTGVSVFANIGLYSFFSLGYYAALVWGAGLISGGAITYGTLMAFLQLISQLRAPLQNVSGIIPQYYSAVASAERLMELENGEDDAPEPEKEKLLKLRKEFESINIKNVSFAYDSDDVLENCTFDIQKGRIVAVTGESGCGKSTLFKLLLGLYEPTGGSIEVNGKIPVNAATRGLFSYVPQGNLILSGTIKENLTLCDGAVSDEQIEKAAKAAEIYDFIMSLPNGFDTVISERGSGLSEGQLQRVAIARALIYDAPILLLDESTSALDEQTETKLLSNIKAMSDKTVVFITHRNTSIGICDVIVHAEPDGFKIIKD